MLKDWDSDQPF